ncbi:MAG: dihydrolipoamide acetyltransferase family protein [Anaerolineales bacterium]
MAEAVNMPKLGFDMAEGKLVRWMLSEGEQVEKGQVLAEIETDKATVEVEASISGTVLKHVIEEGAIVPIGNPIAIVGDEGEEFDLEALLGSVPDPLPEVVNDAPSPSPQPEPAAAELHEGNGKLPGGVRASPLARKLAKDLGVPLGAIAGSGSGGRIVKMDVEAAASGPTSTRMTGSAISRETERVPLTKLRGAIGRRMASSKQQVPHFYVTTEIDAQPFMTMRKEYNEILAEDEKLSVNDFIVKAAALALREFPNLNASLDGDSVVRHGEVNIGIAVAVPDGLLTVVARDADQKPLPSISAEVRAMAERAREGKVHQEDIEGSTFTVSNLGMFDVDHFIAIINPPEAAILAVGGVQERPAVRDGQIVVGMRLKATVSADHRVTDGAEAAQWLQSFKNLLEHPLRLVV